MHAQPGNNEQRPDEEAIRQVCTHFFGGELHWADAKTQIR